MTSQLQQHITDLRKQAESLSTSALVLSREATLHMERALLARQTADQIEALLSAPLKVDYADQIESDTEDKAVTDNEIQGIDIPPYAWLYRNMLTDEQRLAPLGINEVNGQYAIRVADLTEGQRAIPHVAGQLPKTNT